MRKFAYGLFLGIFLLILFAVPVLTKLEPAASISSYENRALAQPPDLTAERVWEGKYFADWEAYLSDHVSGRDNWLRAYTFLNANLLGRVQVNGVLLGGDTLLPYEPTIYARPEDAGAMAADLAALARQLEEWGGQFLYLGVPRQDSIFRDKFPAYLDNNARLLEELEESFFGALEEEGLEYIDFYPLLKAEPDPGVYYLKSDHHYNLLGAYYVYEAFISRLDQMGYTVPSLREGEDFRWKVLDKPFYGSRNRRLYDTSLITDQLLIYEPAEDLAFERYDYGSPAAPEVFVFTDEDYVEYNIYMGGDIGETVIRTNRPELPSVLLFGDSFTNAFETFLYRSFDETRSLDLRSYSAKTLPEYIEEYRPDLVVCLRDDTAYTAFSGNGQVK